MQRSLRGFQKGTLNFCRIFGAGFKVGHGLGALGFAPLCSFGFGNSALGLAINFVANHDESEVVRIARVRLLQKLISPVAELIKGFFGGDIVHKDTRVRTAIEGNAQ